MACVGLLAAACTIWLASYWGPILGALATAGLFAILAIALFLIARLLMRSAVRRPGHSISEAAEAAFREHPAGILGGIFALAFLLGRRPGLAVRAFSGAARSGALLVLLRKILQP